jgi:2-octaprenyl-6-methoxyphenol hydroxylase
MIKDALHDAQVVIQGAGPVGLACTIWLLKNHSDLKIVLVDKNPASDDFLANSDIRGIAISEGSKQLLESIESWVEYAPAIHQVHVSHKGHFGRTVMSRDEIGQEALGHIVRYRDIVLSLRKQLRTLQFQAKYFTWLSDIDEVLQITEVSSQACLIHADGGLFHEQSAKDIHKDYGQSALVGWLEVDDITPNIAWERFTQDGPIAILPHHQGATTKNFVWCAPKETIDRLATLPDEQFLNELSQAIHLPIGQFLQVHDRKKYPLGLNLKKHIVLGREAWIGNAAQTLHPVAGQGLNLGLRDAYTLAMCLNTVFARPSSDLSKDIEAILMQYQKQRSTDRQATIRVTDLMASVFTSNFLPLVIGRGLALSSLQWLPPIKNQLARQMMFGQR